MNALGVLAIGHAFRPSFRLPLQCTLGAPQGTMRGVIAARRNTMGSVEVESGACEAFAQLPKDDGPISMLNLLRFRDEADYAAHPEQTSCSGREEIGRAHV